MSYILSTQHPPPWARSFQDPRDAGPSSAHIPDPVFQTQPEVLSVTSIPNTPQGFVKGEPKLQLPGHGPGLPCCPRFPLTLQGATMASAATEKHSVALVTALQEWKRTTLGQVALRDKV